MHDRLWNRIEFSLLAAGIIIAGGLWGFVELSEIAREAPRSFDYVLCESTYGDRDRIETTIAHRRQVLLAEAREAQKRSGALLIPR